MNLNFDNLHSILHGYVLCKQVGLWTSPDRPMESDNPLTLCFSAFRFDKMKIREVRVYLDDRRTCPMLPVQQGALAGRDCSSCGGGRHYSSRPVRSAVA